MESTVHKKGCIDYNGVVVRAKFSKNKTKNFSRNNQESVQRSLYINLQYQLLVRPVEIRNWNGE